MKQKIGIYLAVVIAILLVTVLGKAVWEKNNQKLGNQDASQKIQINEQNNKENNQNQTITEDANWNTYKNEEFSFKIQYPSSFLFDENLVDGPEYSINFGPSYEETFGKKHRYAKTARNFEMSIRKNERGLDSLIKKGNEVRAAVEQTSKLVGTEKIGNLSAKIIKACDIGGYCDKIVYFVHDKYIYSVYMQNYFTSKDEADKNNFDQMIASLKFLPKQ